MHACIELDLLWRDKGLSRTYLAHHELKSNFVIIIIIIIVIIVIIIIIFIIIFIITIIIIIIIIIINIIEPDARRAHPKSLAHHAGEDEGHDLV